MDRAQMDRAAGVGRWTARSWEGSLSDRCRRAGGIGSAVAVWGLRHWREFQDMPAWVCWRCLQVTLGFLAVWWM